MRSAQFLLVSVIAISCDAGQKHEEASHSERLETADPAKDPEPLGDASGPHEDTEKPESTEPKASDGAEGYVIEVHVSDEKSATKKNRRRAKAKAAGAKQVQSAQQKAHRLDEELEDVIKELEDGT